VFGVVDFAIEPLLCALDESHWMMHAPRIWVHCLGMQGLYVKTDHLNWDTMYTSNAEHHDSGRTSLHKMEM